MARPCGVCQHEQLREIDEQIVSGVPLRRISARFGPSSSALSRHRQDHLSPSLVRVAQQSEDDRAAGLVDQLRGLLEQVRGILASAGDRPATALAAVREARSLIESIGRFTGELDDRPQVAVLNLAASAEWLDLRLRIMRALEDYPDARLAVAAALSVQSEPVRELTS